MGAIFVPINPNYPGRLLSGYMAHMGEIFCKKVVYQPLFYLLPKNLHLCLCSDTLKFTVFDTFFTK